MLGENVMGLSPAPQLEAVSAGHEAFRALGSLPLAMAYHWIARTTLRSPLPPSNCKREEEIFVTERTVESWVDMWNAYDLAQVDKLFLTD
jgi:hypothetical protein